MNRMMDISKIEQEDVPWDDSWTEEDFKYYYNTIKRKFMSDAITDMWRSTQEFSEIESNLKKPLEKFSIRPGQVTLEECNKIKDFLLKYIRMRNIYKEVFNSDQIGLTIESHIDKINWYIDFKKENVL